MTNEEDEAAASRGLVRTQSINIDIALANEVFDHFCSQANTLKSILRSFSYLCEILRLKPTEFPYFYPKIKSKLKSWKAQALWAKFDKRSSHKVYNRGKACAGQRMLVIGAGERFRSRVEEIAQRNISPVLMKGTRLLVEFTFC